MGVVCMSARALVLWLLGAADQALRQMQEALAAARQLEHPLTLTHTLSWAAMFHKHRREVVATQTYTEAAMALARQHGFTPGRPPTSSCMPGCRWCTARYRRA